MRDVADHFGQLRNGVFDGPLNPLHVAGASRNRAALRHVHNIRRRAHTPELLDAIPPIVRTIRCDCNRTVGPRLHHGQRRVRFPMSGLRWSADIVLSDSPTSYGVFFIDVPMNLKPCATRFFFRVSSFRSTAIPQVTLCAEQALATVSTTGSTSAGAA